ncbi:gliding motility-associated protein GldM [Breznakibacter xylanolyticus]|uniref:Gliding motility-associated protein GldM n=1 Tax=Breznakibacter xylanolyticus TaxID=990 RepID=A0A2W7N777_9BACT|nr:gliding motility protein GldM [Breznakibacter xylanolyticus]PZX15930.1 gliding motility-associated protein GldM [Breznakibacter xylanolyticus]
MSGGNCPETPRQKMIGMMYLFLTAMLALNVSGELLKAFELVDKSIQQSVSTVEKKCGILYGDLQNAAVVNPRATQSWENAQKIRVAADELVKQINDLKLYMVQKVSDDPNATPDNYTGADNQDIAAQVMIVEQGGDRSKQLKAKINELKDMLLGYIETDSVLRSNVSAMLSTSDPTAKEGIQRSWESEKFEHLPMSASLALMSKLTSDVRNAEADVLRYLLSKNDEGTFKFNKIEPLVIANSKVVIRGGEFLAQVMVAASDSTADTKIKVNGSDIPVEKGIGLLRVPASSTGKKPINAEIQLFGPDGTPKTYTVKSEYEVIDPMVVISPTKMNVFYEGVENPVTISAPGANSNQLSISMTNATFTKKGDGYMVRVKPGTAGGKSTISVSADIDGKKRNLGSMDFRIKRIPAPIAKVAGKSEGKISKSLLLEQTGVFAEMEDFDFELEYNVTRFVVSAVKNGYSVDEPSTNNRFTPAQKELIRSLGRGSKVFITEIRAVGPDKVSKALGGISLTLD